MDRARNAARFRRIEKTIGPIIVVLIFAAALWLLNRELKHYTLADLREGVSRTPALRLALALGLTVLNYVILIGYDLLSIRSIAHPMPLRRVALASFIGYACSYNFGSLLGGTSVRYRLYSMWGLSAVEILKLLVMLGVTFWVGFLALAGGVFLFEPLTVPAAMHLPFSDVRPIGIVLVACVVAYLVACAARRRPIRVKQWEFSFPSPAIAALQIVVAAADLLVAAAAMYVLLPPEIAPSYMAFLGIYLLSVLAVLFTHVPGGLGVFELVMVWSFADSDAHLLLGSLLVFRVVYYLVPLLVAAVMFVAVEVTAKWSTVKRWSRPAGAVARESVPRIMTVLVFAAGVVLLLSGATPAAHDRTRLLRQLLPLPVIEVSHFLGSITGILLILLARGLQRRIETAYWVALGMLGAGALFSLLKGLDYEEAVILGVMLALLAPCRRYFYRRGALLTQRFSPGWFVAMGVAVGSVVWLMLFAFKHVEYSDDLWWRFAFHGNAPRSLRAIAGVVLVALIVATTRLLGAKHRDPQLPTEEDLQQARYIVMRCPRTSANLALIGDKHFFFNEDKSAFVMFGIEGRSWVSMGDPVGERKAADDLAWDFREYCDAGGCWPVFYQVQEDRLSLYVEMGLSLIKLGEEARVPLANFGLEGGSRQGLRRTNKKLAEAGYKLEIVQPELSDGQLAELKRVSDAWLNEKSTGEKGFSLGFFQAAYIRRCPIAVIRCNEQIVAFANIWCGADHDELSIDLMRYLPEAPAGVMEFLFIQLMLWGQQNGFRWFNLGMAPLSGIDAEQRGPLWNQIAALTFRHGEHFYHFQGLRQYKEKFDPVWTPKYLASPGRFSLPLVLMNATTLISRGSTALQENGLLGPAGK